LRSLIRAFEGVNRWEEGPLILPVHIPCLSHIPGPNGWDQSRPRICRPKYWRSKLEISGAVGVVGEDGLSGIAALSNMMREIGDGGPGQTCHE
jgi:hypothetical protein